MRVTFIYLTQARPEPAISAYRPSVWSLACPATGTLRELIKTKIYSLNNKYTHIHIFLSDNISKSVRNILLSLLLNWEGKVRHCLVTPLLHGIITLFFLAILKLSLKLGFLSSCESLAPWQVLPWLWPHSSHTLRLYWTRQNVLLGNNINILLSKLIYWEHNEYLEYDVFG